mmetsp:Transcript_50543/g.145082  ORF Transcript_50543/g.145082 Transcript_50543/m.145082 type:complete len:232 (-) Transcript_50543:71-766(-)
MDDHRLAQTAQGLKQLHRDNPDRVQRHALEIVLLQDIVQVHAQKLEHDTQVLSPDEVIKHADNPVLVLRIELGVQTGQNFHLHSGLVEVSGLVFNDFQRHLRNIGTVLLLNLDNLSEGALSEPVLDLVGLPAGLVHDCVADFADVVVLSVVPTVVVHRLCDLRQHPLRCRFEGILIVLATTIVGLHKLGGDSLDELASMRIRGCTPGGTARLDAIEGEGFLEESAGADILG